MIQAYTNDQTLFTRENFTFKCHEPLPIPTDEIDVDKFFGRWDCLIQSAFDGLPIFIRDSIEVKALSKLLGNVQFKNTAQKFVERHGGVRQGLVAMMESIVDIMPVTAKQEYFAFMQYAIAPYSHLYTECDALVLKNMNLMDMLLIGHHQFDLFIFDRGLIDSHAISFALKMKLPVVVTNHRVPHSSSPQLVQVAQANHRAEANYESVPYSACLQVAPIEVGHKELVNG
ncbi:MAG TPA: hypothetical protein DEH24_00025 [Alteromonas sp.]|nr:hypothetical protein [Alteromonas sp.]